MKNKEEYRYQFLRFETVGTGKYLTPKSLDLTGDTLGLGEIFKDHLHEITKEVAVVFDKKLGIVKYTDIKK